MTRQWFLQLPLGLPVVTKTLRRLNSTSRQSRETWGGVCRARQPAQRHKSRFCVSHMPLRVLNQKSVMGHSGRGGRGGSTPRQESNENSKENKESKPSVVKIAFTESCLVLMGGGGLFAAFVSSLHDGQHAAEYRQ